MQLNLYIKKLRPGYLAVKEKRMMRSWLSFEGSDLHFFTVRKVVADLSMPEELALHQQTGRQLITVFPQKFPLKQRPFISIVFIQNCSWN